MRLRSKSRWVVGRVALGPTMPTKQRKHKLVTSWPEPESLVASPFDHPTPETHRRLPVGRRGHQQRRVAEQVSSTHECSPSRASSLRAIARAIATES